MCKGGRKAKSKNNSSNNDRSKNGGGNDSRMHLALTVQKQDNLVALSGDRPSKTVMMSNEDVYLDSGVSDHYFKNKKWFMDYVVTPNEKPITGIEKGHSVEVSGKGSINCKFFLDDGDTVNVLIKDIMHVPNFSSNLISVGRLECNGCRVVFERGNATVWKDKQKIMTAERKGDVYRINMLMMHSNVPDDDKQAYATSAKPDNALTMWHRCMGHISADTIVKIAKDDEFGVTLHNGDKDEFCDTCIKGKAKQLPFNKERTGRASRLLELVHMDICGPLNVTSLGRC